MAINFPSEPSLNQIFEHKLDDGSSILYKYDENKGWLLMPTTESSYVNKDYVDSHDELKYDKVGGRVSGIVEVGRFGRDEPSIRITDTGTFSFFKEGDSKISFDEGGSNTLSVDDTTILRFGVDRILTYTTIQADNTNKPIISYSVSGIKKDVIILQSESDDDINNIIQINNDGNSCFSIKPPTTEPVFKVTGSGETSLFSNRKTLNVSRLNGSNREAFSVDPSTYKITSSDLYNTGLLEGSREVEQPQGNNISVQYKDDNLLATLGLVKKYQYTPGQAVFAENESDTEINGLWTDGTNYYIRYQ